MPGPTLLPPAPFTPHDDHLPNASPDAPVSPGDAPADLPADASPHPAIRGGRREGRVSTEMLLARAEFLPPAPRALATAHFSLGMSAQELAALHNVTPRQMRRRLEQLRETLKDPAFILAARYADQLPKETALLARAYWVEGIPLRALASQRSQSIHYIRRRIAEARSLLLLQLRNDREVPPAIAQRTLTRRNRPRR